jgi:hypothetical protein
MMYRSEIGQMDSVYTQAMPFRNASEEAALDLLPRGGISHSFCASELQSTVVITTPGCEGSWFDIMDMYVEWRRIGVSTSLLRHVRNPSSQRIVSAQAPTTIHSGAGMAFVRT